jgi:hypothetical protein
MVAPDVINPEVLSSPRRAPPPHARAAAGGVDASGHNVSPHDACHVALAGDLGCALVTGDLKLSRAPRLGVPLLIV